MSLAVHGTKLLACEDTCSETAEEGCTNKGLEAAAAQLAYHS